MDIDTLDAQVVDSLNDAKLASSPEEKVKLLTQVKEVTFFQDPSFQLLQKYAPMVCEFHLDPAAVVRKFVISYIVEACKKHLDVIPLVYPTLAFLANDSNAKVASASILAMNNTLRRCLYWLCLHDQPKDDALSKPLYDTVCSIVGLIKHNLESDNDMVVSQTLNLNKSFVMCVLEPETLFNVPIPADRIKPLNVRAIDDRGGASAFSRADVIVGHKVIDPVQWERFGQDLTQALIEFIRNLSAGKSKLKNVKQKFVAAVASLSALVETRPTTRPVAVPFLVELAKNKSLPPLVKSSLKTHGLKLLKMVAMVPFQSQLKEMLTEIGAAAQIPTVLAAVEAIERDHNRRNNRRPRPSGGDDKNTLKRKAPKLINLSTEQIENFSPSETADWVIQNIKFLPPTAPPHPTNTPKRQVSLDFLEVLIYRAKDERIRMAAATEEQVVEQVRAVSMKKDTPLVVNKDAQLRSAFERIYSSAYFSSENVHHQSVNDLVSRLACSWDAETNLRDELMNFLADKLETHLDALIALMHHEYANDLLYAQPNQDREPAQRMDRYASFALSALKCVMQSKKEDLTWKVLKYAPRLTPGMFAVVLDLFLNTPQPSRAPFGLQCVYFIIRTRPPFTAVCVETVIYLAFAKQSAVRDTAIKLLLTIFAAPDEPDAEKDKIRRFAQLGLESALSPQDAQDAEETPSNGRHPFSLHELANIAQYDRFLADEALVGTIADDEQAEVKRRVALFTMLCKKEHTLLSQYLAAFVQANAAGRTCLRNELLSQVTVFQDVADEITASKTLALLDPVPEGSEDLVVEVVQQLANLTPNPRSREDEPNDRMLQLSGNTVEDVLQAVYTLSTESPGSSDGEDLPKLYEKDVRVLIPVAQAMNRKDLMKLLVPRVLDYSVADMRRCVQNILNSPNRELEPAALLLELMATRPDQLKVMMRVTDVCFAEKQFYTSQVWAIVMQKVVDWNPVPEILARIMPKSVAEFNSLYRYVVSEIFPRLVKKKVWQKWGKFWFLCIDKMGASADVVMMLPPDQQAAAFEKYPAWKENLRKYRGAAKK